MKRPSRHPEEQALRYDYALAHEAMVDFRTKRRKWSHDYDMCLLERLAILFAIVAPSLAVYLWL